MMKPVALYILILLFLVVPASGSAAEMVLVVHKDNPVEQMDLAEARNIFLGKKTLWASGRAINVYLQKDNERHRQFAQQILGKSPRQLQMHWKRVLFSGLGVPPREVPDDQTVIERVAGNPQAIGYIDSRNQTDRIKVITIDSE
jgi:ABC-type phosphate transport system substrate-binding protein